MPNHDRLVELSPTTYMSNNRAYFVSRNSMTNAQNIDELGKMASGGPELTANGSRPHLSRKVALVTGSSSGIGANIAIDLTKAGYVVVVTGRNLISLDAIVRQCHEACNLTNQDRAFACVADLMSDDDIETLVNFIRLKFNRLDVLVNNVCARGEPVSLIDDEKGLKLSAIMHLNVIVPMNLVHKCLHHKLFPTRTDDAPSQGVVINISSIASQVVVPLHLYSISKACLSEFTRQLASLSDVTNVLSVTVSPGPVFTEERPHHQAMSKYTLMGRVGLTQEVSNLVVHAIEHAALFNGRELTIDGGYMAQQKQSSPTR